MRIFCLSANAMASWMTLARDAETAKGTLPSRTGTMASILSTGLKPGDLAARSF